jgi:hypothetical protein
MEPIYRYSESTVKPVELEKSKRSIFLRKDMVEEERTDNEGNVTTFWTYQEAVMSHDDYNEYISLMQAKNVDNITNLVTGQKNGDDNQLAIMEAIAFLYETIVEKGGSL